METLETLLAEVQKNSRACPQPEQWLELYEIPSNNSRMAIGWKPGPPLILAAWTETPTLLKAIRLREHIEWAEAHGCLEQVAVFLRGLPEEKWHHFGE